MHFSIMNSRWYIVNRMRSILILFLDQLWLHAYVTCLLEFGRVVYDPWFHHRRLVRSQLYMRLPCRPFAGAQVNFGLCLDRQQSYFLDFGRISRGFRLKSQSELVLGSRRIWIRQRKRLLQASSRRSRLNGRTWLAVRAGGQCKV